MIKNNHLLNFFFPLFQTVGMSSNLSPAARSTSVAPRIASAGSEGNSAGPLFGLSAHQNQVSPDKLQSNSTLKFPPPMFELFFFSISICCVNKSIRGKNKNKYFSLGAEFDKKLPGP